MFYGGAGGGGKSIALLMAALRYVHVPGYSALLVRRTYADLAMPGAIMDRAREWLGGTDARWNESRKQWRFPSGAVLSFGYMDTERDKYRYKSAEYQFIGCDEATELAPSQYTYLFTRLRRLEGMPVPLRMRAASNPGGPGHEFFKLRFVRPDAPHPDRAFVPARMDDNPTLDVGSYRKGLREVDPIERARIEEGDWDAVEGGRFRREYFLGRRWWRNHHGDYVLSDGYSAPDRECWRFATCDPAASAEETARTDDPDYTVMGTFAVTPRRDLLWLSNLRFRREIPDIVGLLEDEYALWSPAFLAVEVAASNRAVYQLAARTRMVVMPLEVGAKDKLVRATAAMVLARTGKFYLPRSAEWLDEVESELFRFTGNARKDGHDDIVDVAGMAGRVYHDHHPEDDGLPLGLRRK